MSTVLLVNPPGTSQCDYTPTPLGLLYLAAMLRNANHQVRVVDGALKDWSAVDDALLCRYDFVGVTALTTSRHNALEVLRRARPHCSFTVIGGVHATLMANQIHDNYGDIVDYVVKGPGENAMVEIANMQYPVGSIVEGHIEKNLDKLPFPAWDMVDWREYPPRGWGRIGNIDLTAVPRIPVIMSRGCTGNCIFCSSWHVWGGHHSRSGHNMADEMEMLYDQGVRHFVFQDDLMTGDQEAVKQLCSEILFRQMKIAWFATTRTDCVTLDLLKLMKRAGCYEISYGVETGSPAMLQRLHKENTLDHTREVFRWMKMAGIKSTALMMFGLPGETEEDRRLSNLFVQEINPDECGSVGHVMVLPGTALYQHCKRICLINDSFWLGPEPYWTYREG